MNNNLDYSNEEGDLTTEMQREFATKGMVSEFDRRGANMSAEIIVDYLTPYGLLDESAANDLKAKIAGATFSKLDDETKEKLDDLIGLRIKKLTEEIASENDSEKKNKLTWERDRLVSMLGTFQSPSFA